MRTLGVLALLTCAFLGIGINGCNNTPSSDIRQIKATIIRFNQLLSEGYRKMNMNPLQEVATPEQAEKLYSHMAAIGEGRLRMESTLKNISFVKVQNGKDEQATVETKETWDFIHININDGSKFAEERNFIYEMGYTLQKRSGRWIVTNVNTINGTSTDTVIPWPEIDRQGRMKHPGKEGTGSKEPVGHP